MKYFCQCNKCNTFFIIFGSEPKKCPDCGWYFMKWVKDDYFKGKTTDIDEIREHLTKTLIPKPHKEEKNEIVQTPEAIYVIFEETQTAWKYTANNPVGSVTHENYLRAKEMSYGF